MASKRAIRRRGCDKKNRYSDEAHARNDASAICQKTGLPMNVYRCGFCGSLHVGHMPAKVQRAIEARREAA